MKIKVKGKEDRTCEDKQVGEEENRRPMRKNKHSDKG